MLLILTNSQDVTADYLGSLLISEGVDFLRFDTDTSVVATKIQYSQVRPELYLAGKRYLPQDFTNVWYRRPERLKHPNFNDSSEGKFVLDEWADALEGFFAHIPKANWMNHPASNMAASLKIEQLTTATSLGLVIPDTLVTHDAEALRDFAAIHRGKLIVKPLAKGYVERQGGNDSVVYTNQVLLEHLEHLDDLACCPSLFQQFIDKCADIRITVVDEHFHAVELIAQGPDGRQRCDIRRNNMEDVKYRVVTLPPEIEAKIRLLTAHYGLRFAAIDMVVSVDCEWFFLEINPNGQWAWMDHPSEGVCIKRSVFSSLGGVLWRRGALSYSSVS